MAIAKQKVLFSFYNFTAMQIKVFKKLLQLQTCLGDFIAKAVKGIITRVTGEVLHLVVQNPRKLIIHGIRQSQVCHFSIVLHKPHVYILQVKKWHSSCMKKVI
jgi:hypothetical protein